MEEVLVETTSGFLLMLVINSSPEETKSQAASVSHTEQNYAETARLHGKIFLHRIYK